MNKKLLIRATIAFTAFCLLWSAVYASYWIYGQPASITSSAYSLANFNVTPDTINVNENVTLSVTLDVKNASGGPFPVSGALIHFYQGDTPGSGPEIGNATTDATGTATLIFTVHNFGQISFYPGYLVGG